MPRLAHVISTVHGLGGAERLLSALVAEGDRRAWTQRVLNPFVNDPSAALEQEIGSDRYRGRAASGVKGLLDIRRWVASELDSFRPDLVHVVLFRAAVTVATLPRGNIRRVHTHAYGENVRLPPYAGLKERLDRWAGGRYDHSVAISTAGHRLLVDDYGYPSTRVTYLAPGWDGHPLPPSPPAEPTIVCVAKLRAEKGHDLLLDALRMVQQEIGDVRLVLVGDGELRSTLEAQAARLGISDRVEFAGDVPDVWPHLARAHVFALASRSEAFGIAAVEAMAAGLPVVGPATGGLLDLIRPGITGATFPPGDARALADKLVELLSDPAGRDAMAEAARVAAEPFRRAATLERYFALFSELVEGRSDGATTTPRRNSSA